MPGFKDTYRKLKLESSNAFAVLITDIFVNTSLDADGTRRGKAESCLLLERFGSLLNQLSGTQVKEKAALHELLNTYETSEAACPNS